MLWWGRARAGGLEALPPAGPLLIASNHDSQWDPLVILSAARKRRQLRFLARANLWRIFGVAWLLNGLHQIPIERGSHDSGALDQAIAELRAGEAICVFPEGRLSLGKRQRVRSGIARLAVAVPEAPVVLCAVSGAGDYVRFPRRPRVRIEFFEPAGGQIQPGEQPDTFAERLMDDVRVRVPPVAAGRNPEKVAARHERRLAALDEQGQARRDGERD